jgi:hypothetical protein
MLAPKESGDPMTTMTSAKAVSAFGKAASARLSSTVVTGEPIGSIIESACLHHFNGRGGCDCPLWDDALAKKSNLSSSLPCFLCDAFAKPVAAEDLHACIAAVAAHAGSIERFRGDLATPGLRIPMTASATLFFEAVELGRRIEWVHTFGGRYLDGAAGRPADPPRLPQPASAPKFLPLAPYPTRLKTCPTCWRTTPRSSS